MSQSLVVLEYLALGDRNILCGALHYPRTSAENKINVMR